ncbi:hypothetical protein G6F57_021771 [Rhizopus arrhizus]|nr:hypothetical protein G6F57_021771 [Rhizopus arrhizus]
MEANMVGLLGVRGERSVEKVADPGVGLDVVLEIDGGRGQDQQHAEALLQAMRVARQPAYPGGDGLAAIGDGQHGNAGADGENQQQGAGLPPAESRPHSRYRLRRR